MRLLVTGGCGFIGSNFIRHILQHYKPALVSNVDVLTYAGNLANLNGVVEEYGDDIAGNPVNIASKMAQDKGKPGKLYLSSSMKTHIDVSKFAEVSYVVSGIDVTAYEG